MVLVTQMDKWSFIVMETKIINSLTAIESLSGFSDLLQNLWWLLALIFTLLVLVYTLFSIRRKTNKYTCKKINQLIKDGKYIPGIFVELNESKEVLRYFIYVKRWKKRLIKSYNFVYDNAYGDILKKACDKPRVKFRLGKNTSLVEIEKVVSLALELHNDFRESKVRFKTDYEESQVLFEILHYPYTEALGYLQKYSTATNKNYFVLTGSAGNGKTNLLCSISELLVKLKQAVVFLNAREIEGDALDFLFRELKISNKYNEHKDISLLSKSAVGCSA